MMTATQIRKARAALGWGQADLAKAAGLPLHAVILAEGIGPRVVPMTTTVAIVKAFKAAGIESGTPPGPRVKAPDEREPE
jgi:DNA-binding XRE family transcriptional regulator